MREINDGYKAVSAPEILGAAGYGPNSGQPLGNQRQWNTFHEADTDGGQCVEDVMPSGKRQGHQRGFTVDDRVKATASGLHTDILGTKVCPGIDAEGQDACRSRRSNVRIHAVVGIQDGPSLWCQAFEQLQLRAPIGGQSVVMA